jgi:RNA polymerase sigma-70 factor (ECF subfamily)
MAVPHQIPMFASRQATSPRKLHSVPRRLPDADGAVGSAGEHSHDAGPSVEASRDAALVRGALEGDQVAFAELVERYQRKGFWIAYHTIGRVEDARDVVQDAFLRVYRSLHKFDFERNFYTWFYRIVMNLAIDALRKGKSARAGIVEDLSDKHTAPTLGDCPMVQNETRGLVWQVLERMDAKFKSVLVLRDIHGMSCREIAPILKVTHATVRWRLHRGRKLFRERWERLERKWG